MKIASVAEIKSQFSAFLKASAAGPIVITRNVRPVAVIVGVQDENKIESLLMAYSPRLHAPYDLPEVGQRVVGVCGSLVGGCIGLAKQLAVGCVGVGFGAVLQQPVLNVICPGDRLAAAQDAART